MLLQELQRNEHGPRDAIVGKPQRTVSATWLTSLYILDEVVLRLVRAAWNDIFAIEDTQEPGVEQRQYRHAAYRQYVLWQHGCLGIGNRVSQVVVYVK